MTEARPLLRPVRARVTLRDLARIAGVSEPTVSRSLRDDPQISARTRANVQRVADQLGYVPNAAARSLATRTSQTLGLMVPDVTDPVHGQIVSGFEHEATRCDYAVLVSNFRYDPAAERRGLTTLVSNQAGGIAVFGGVMDPGHARSIVGSSALVFIGPEYRSDLGGIEDKDTITADDAAGVTEAVVRAAALGYRRFGYFSGPDVASYVRRRNAATEAVTKLGFEPLRVYDGENASMDTLRGRLVDDGRDLLLCFDDQRALQLLSALREAGVRVPDQLGLIGFDDIPFAAISNPPLSSVSIPYETMGRLGCQMLIQQMTTGSATGTVRVDAKVVLRGTTARRPASGRPRRTHGVRLGRALD